MNTRQQAINALANQIRQARSEGRLADASIYLEALELLRAHDAREVVAKCKRRAEEARYSRFVASTWKEARM